MTDWTRLQMAAHWRFEQLRERGYDTHTERSRVLRQMARLRDFEQLCHLLSEYDWGDLPV